MTDGTFLPRLDDGDAGVVDAPTRAVPSIGWLAWRVFAPLDLVINAVINGSIAWWLYGGRAGVPLTGPGGLTTMALPMSFILATVTTFCGFWNAVRERRAGRATPPLAADARWMLRAAGESLTAGVATWLVAVAVAAGLARAAPTATLGPVGAIAAIAGLAAALGFLLHGRAVMRGGAV
ncbi:MAG: hypothetical protein RLZZ111_1215 [Planctomycetota bacterium]|jgi:hypothetical protein